MAAQNEPNFALFTSSDLDFLKDELFTEKEILKELFTTVNQINDTLMVLLVLFMSFAHILCNRYDARWISKTKSQNTRKWRNGGLINPLLDGSIYSESGGLKKFLIVTYGKGLVKNRSMLASKRGNGNGSGLL